MVPAIITASVALVVAVLTAMLTPAVTSWRARRQAMTELFDSAASALLIAQSSRRYTTGPGFPTEGWTEDEERRFFVQLQQSGITKLVDAQVDARAALAKLVPFVPEIRDEVVRRWELQEDDLPVVTQLIESRRHEAIKSERLFRLRRLPRELPES